MQEYQARDRDVEKISPGQVTETQTNPSPLHTEGTRALNRAYFDDVFAGCIVNVD
jgi:hypothetical protein